VPDRANDDIVLVLGTSGGGVGRHVRALAEGLVQRRRRVTVAGPAETDAAFGFTAAGARFAAVDIADRPRPRSDVQAVRRLRAVTSEAGVVHAHGLRAGALCALADAGRRERAPLVVTLHNAPPTGAGRAAAGVYAALERVVARRADVVLGVSPDLEERMRRLGAGEVGAAVVPAPLTAPAAQGARERVRDELRAGDRAVVLTVARLAPQKGLGLLLDAAALLARSAAPPLVVVAGSGPLDVALRQRVEREALPVVLLGARDDVPSLLAAADVVVVSSQWEGQPIFVQEALRAGRALVATATGGTPRVVGDAAVLVPYGDAPSLAAELQALLDDADRRTALGNAALRRAAELPSDADAVDAAEAVYGRADGKHREAG
jgi:glycosyltransferase involved in cell wall biosynthesis